MWSLRERDPDGLATAVLGLCERRGPLNEDAFRSDIRRLVYQHWIYGSSDFSRLMSAMFGVLASNGLKLDQALTLAVKSLVQAEELVRTLSPHLPLVDTGYEEARELLEAEITLDRIVDMAKSEATATAMEIGRRLPSLRSATVSWLDQYQRGKFVVTLDTSDLQKGLTSVGSVSRNLTVGLIVAGQLIAVALVLAVIVLSGSLSDEIVAIAIAAFGAFLVFSVLVVRRVSNAPG